MPADDVRDRLNELEEQLGRECCIEFLTIVVETMPVQAADLLTAIRERNVEAAERAAHKLRGSVGTVGASGMARNIAAMEERIAVQDLSTALSMEEELAASVRHLLGRLTAFIAEADEGPAGA
jgi:HPt (histidine-containing phosphotransfer) domain-containing protein